MTQHEIGIVSLVATIFLGVVACWIAVRSARFNFHQANADLYNMRLAISNKPDDLGWLAWASFRCCARAAVVQRWALPRERAFFIEDIAYLLRFAFRRREHLTWESADHLLEACEEASGMPELRTQGHRILHELEPWFGLPLPGEDVTGFVKRVRKTVEGFRATIGKGAPFDPRAFKA